LSIQSLIKSVNGDCKHSVIKKKFTDIKIYQKPQIEEKQTRQWLKEKGQTDKTMAERERTNRQDNG
jgi:hypothetical protein